jgi:hypothetical protein
MVAPGAPGVTGSDTGSEAIATIETVAEGGGSTRC